MSYHILQNASAVKVVEHPFPHFVIDDALPADVYDRLASSYPDPERMLDKRKRLSNKRYNLLSRWGATEFDFEDASPDWRAFVETNESTEFVQDAFRMFPNFTEESVEGKRINLAPFGPGLPAKLGTDRLLRFDEIKPRVTLAVNTPSTDVTSVRGPHCDNVRKAYVGLLYFRQPEDDSVGGDLEIYGWKDGSRRDHWPVAVDEDQVEKLKTIEYRPNRLIFFLTTDCALHGVTPRSKTPHWRRLVVISGWFPGVDYYDTDTMHGRIAGAKARVISLSRRILGKQRIGNE